MERQNIKISIDEISSSDKFKKYKSLALEKNLINLEKNLKEFNNVNKNINKDLTNIQNNLLNLTHDNSYKIVETVAIDEPHPTKRYDIYADVCVSNVLCDFLNIPSGVPHIKNNIVISVYDYIKKQKLIHFGGYFLVDLKLQKIFPQNGDYCAKRDKFLKITNIYSMLSRHFTKKN